MIGRNGGLPWRLPSDLKMFRRLTMGKPVVMGRRTFESIGRPLDGRDNIVVTRDREFAAVGVHVVHTVEAAMMLARQLAVARGAAEIAVIGGAEVFKQVIDGADRIYLTRVHGEPDGNTVMPDPDPAAWSEISRTPLPRGVNDEFAATLVILERTRP